MSDFEVVGYLIMHLLLLLVAVMHIVSENKKAREKK